MRTGLLTPPSVANKEQVMDDRRLALLLLVGSVWLLWKGWEWVNR